MITEKEIVKKAHLPFYIKNSLNGIEGYLNCSVNVKVSDRNKGKITIPFSSEEDFLRIKKLLQ